MIPRESCSLGSVFSTSLGKSGSTKTINIYFHRDISKDRGGTSMYVRALSSQLSKYFTVNIFMYSDSDKLIVSSRNNIKLCLVPRPRIPVLSLLQRSSEGKKIYDALTAFSPKLCLISEKIMPAHYVLCVDVYCAVIAGPLLRMLGKKFILRSNDSILSMALQISGSYSRIKGLTILLYALIIESYLLRVSHLVSVPSRKTMQLFKKFYGLENKVFVSPPGNEGSSGTNFFSVRQLYGLTQTQPVILFIGTGNWPPNILAIKYIQDELAPFLEREFPQSRILIVGSKTEAFKSRTKTKNLFVVGEADDLGPYLESADLAIAPVTVVGGVSAKTIEYLCSGLPVVTTETVAKTLIPQFGIFTSTMEEFHLKVAETLKNPFLREMRQAIRREALENYSWDRIGLDFARHIQNMFRT